MYILPPTDRNVADGSPETGVGKTFEEKGLWRRHVISVKTHKTPPDELGFG